MQSAYVRRESGSRDEATDVLPLHHSLVRYAPQAELLVEATAEEEAIVGGVKRDRRYKVFVLGEEGKPRQLGVPHTLNT